jgi:hypothetical protein
VLPVGSLSRSRRSVPIAFVGNEPDTNSHFGALLSALSVNQTPPPAAPSSSSQLLGEQPGFSESAVIRPDAW